MGFTMTELVMVIVIIGILAVAAIPRFFDRQAFESRGFHEQIKAVVRYAHKAAIAQHRAVFVNTTVNAICLTYVADAACTNVTAADVVLNPANGQRFSQTAPANVSLTAASFSFSALGQPSTGAVTIGVTGDGMTRNVVIERETGYVH
ncbi:MAG: type secretion system protein [Burkholderiaceae bacterium]|nr:type secretion system protein [Burkholderiaceae bacterium]